jgi:hypothetical protein
MNNQPGNAGERVLIVQLAVHLDSLPVHGSLSTASGAQETFVGWLEFVDALKRLHEQQTAKRREQS